MYPRRIFPGRLWAPRLWPQSNGDDPEPPVETFPTGSRRGIIGRRMRALRMILFLLIG